MKAYLETFISFRYLRSGNKKDFLSFISIISMVGISLAVAVLLTVISVMNGFEYQLQKRVLGVAAHSTIIDSNGPIEDWSSIGKVILKDSKVLNISPYVNERGLIILNKNLLSLNLRGVDPALEKGVSQIDTMFSEGSFTSLSEGKFNIVIGASLSRELGAKLGDEVIIMTPEGVPSPIGLSPRMRIFTISGIFDVGMYEYDRGLAYINISDARLLFRKGSSVDGIRLLLDNAFSVTSITDDIVTNLGKSYYSNDWTSRYVNFFRSIQITKSIMFVIFSLIIAVAAFNIVSTLTMVVRDKRSDIAILSTMGISRYSILLIFLLIGLIIGIIGTFFGILVGIVVSFQLSNIVYLFELYFNIDLLAEDVYFLSDIPTQIRVFEVIRVSSFAILLSIMATLLPAISAFKRNPSEGLHHE
ncbi:MAG: hypothetical protein CBC38_05450 [Gammaproteobacteria bacterium TMED78]|nr:MAG: hypothetical protein CBC38_05450 [Gammaproteobacteria bacterium TMED78]|tara:strand:- start:70369 stop:71616 length:1248 start_codon:yes stop_codon:yes gene_type:complete